MLIRRGHKSETEPRNEKRKRKSEKQLSPDNRVEVNEMSNILDASETDYNRKKHVPSSCTFEACEPVLTQTSEQQSALLDKNLQLADTFTAQNMENHTAINTKPKKSKERKKSDACENSFHNQRPVGASPCSLPENVQSIFSLDIVKEDSLRNDKEAPTSVRLLALVESENSGLKKSELVPENSSNSHGVKNDGLICAKKAKQKGKSVSLNCSKNKLEAVKEDVCSTSSQVAQRSNSANSSFVQEIIETDSGKQNRVKTCINGNNTALGEKESKDLMTSDIADSTRNNVLIPKSPEVKCTYSKRRKKIKVVKDTSYDHSQSNMEKVQEDISAHNSTLMESAQLYSVEKNNSGASTSKNLTSLVNKEEISLTNGVETGSTKKMGMFSEINSMIHGDSRKDKKKKKGKGKNDVSESSSLQEVIETESPRDNMISAVNKEENVDMEGRVLKKAAEAGLPKEKEIFPETSSRRNEVTNISSIQTGISKEEGKSNCSDRFIKPLQEDVSNFSVKTPISKKKRNKKNKLKHTTPEERSSMNETAEMNCDFLGELQKATKICMVSLEENLDGSSTNSEVSLPHSSGQGTIDASPLTNKEDNSFRSFKGEKASFSYQVVGNAVKNESSVDHSEKASESNKRDERKNEKPTHSVDNALHDNNTFNSSSEQPKQKNEDFNELQRHNSRKVKKFCSPSFDVVTDEVTLDVIDKCEKTDKAPLSPERAILACTSKKLIVLDLNGLLVDVIYDSYNVHRAPIKVGGKSVFKRPFCDEFLKFCFDVFDVGVWSSRRQKNVSDVVDFLMGDLKHKLLFCWDQSKCTITGFNTIENVHKPLVLKELKKLWNKEEPDLPWEKGEYSPSNTLLVDDSPYKALCNPPNTAIFPYPYNFQNENDKSLGPAGDIRVYLEGLAMADDVQHYVRENPFGQRAITSSNPSWKFYLRVIDTTQKYSVPTC